MNATTQAALGGARAARRRRAFGAAALALLLVWPPLAWLAADWLVVESELAQADALVVLAGASTYQERAAHAARLYAEGFAPKILLSDDGQRGGWSQEQQRNPFFVERAAEVLAHAGVPADKIETLPGRSASTYEESLALRMYAEARGTRSLLIVTSGYHTRRARWTLGRAFRGSGVRVRLAGVQPGVQTPRRGLWWLSASGWRSVALEYPKLVYYQLRYG